MKQARGSAPSFSLLWGLLLWLVGGLSTGDQPTPPPPHLSREGGEEERRAEDGGDDGGRGERGDLSGRRRGVGGAVEGGLALQGVGSVGCRGCARGPPVVGRRVLLGVRRTRFTWNKAGDAGRYSRRRDLRLANRAARPGRYVAGAPLEEASTLDLYRGVVLHRKISRICLTTCRVLQSSIRALRLTG